MREEAHVEVSLGSDLESDVRSSRLGVPDRLGTGLDVLRDLVVVRSREDREVRESVNGDRVRRSGVTETESVARDRSGRDRVGRLGTEEETVTTDDLFTKQENQHGGNFVAKRGMRDY